MNGGPGRRVARGGGHHGRGEGGAEQSEGAGVLFLDRADGDTEAGGDLPVREQIELAEEQHGAAALGQAGDRLLEQVQLLAGHDLLGDPGRGGGGGLGVGGVADEGRDAPALEPVDGQPAGGEVKEGAGLGGLVAGDDGVDPEVGVMGDVLRLAGIAEQARKLAAQRRECGAVEGGEVPRFGRRIVRHRGEVQALFRRGPGDGKIRKSVQSLGRAWFHQAP